MKIMKRLIFVLLLSVILAMSSFGTDIKKKTIVLNSENIENVKVNIPSTVKFYQEDCNQMSIISNDSIILHMIRYQVNDRTLIIDLNNRNLNDNCNDLNPIDIQIRLPHNVQLVTTKNMQILDHSTKNYIKSANNEK